MVLLQTCFPAIYTFARAGQWGTCHIFDDATCVAASCCFIDVSHITRHSGVFSTFFSASLPFRVTHTLSHHTHTPPQPLLAHQLFSTPAGGQINTFRPAVILHHFWRSNSPFPTQQSSSTTSGGQIHPSPPSGHPSPLLVVKLTPLRPAVILHHFWRSNSPLPAQWSFSTPACG